MRPGRIELPSRPWQGRVLPLNDGRKTNVRKYSRFYWEFNRELWPLIFCSSPLTKFLGPSSRFVLMNKHCSALHKAKISRRGDSLTLCADCCTISETSLLEIVWLGDVNNVKDVNLGGVLSNYPSLKPLFLKINPS